LKVIKIAFNFCYIMLVTNRGYYGVCIMEGQCVAIISAGGTDLYYHNEPPLTKWQCALS